MIYFEILTLMQPGCEIMFLLALPLMNDFIDNFGCFYKSLAFLHISLLYYIVFLILLPVIILSHLKICYQGLICFEIEVRIFITGDMSWNFAPCRQEFGFHHCVPFSTNKKNKLCFCKLSIRFS